MRKRIVALWIGFAVVLAAGVRAGEEEAAPLTDAKVSAREKVAKFIRDFDAPYSHLRIQAVQQAGAMVDFELAREFEVVDKLMAKAKDGGDMPSVREAALNALMTLNKNGYDDKRILDFVAKMVGEATDLQVRIAALNLIGQMAAANNDQSTWRAFNALEEIWKAERMLPDTMKATLLEAIGGYAAEDKTLRILADGLEDRSAEVRNGAFRGIERYLAAGGEFDRDLARTLMRPLLSIKPEEVKENPQLRDTRLQIMNCLERLADRGFDFSTTGKVKETFRHLALEGTDEESRAAVRFLIRIVGQGSDTEDNVAVILDAFKKKRDYDTVKEYTMALGELIYRLKESARKSTKRDLAKRIIDHFEKLLTYAGATDELRSVVIGGLGNVPDEFDRQKVVAMLIQYMEARKDTPQMVEACEASLRRLTGKAFRKKDPESKKEVPDFEMWRQWYAANKEKLEEGETPWGKPDPRYRRRK